MRKYWVILAIIFISACSTNPDKITAAYVPTSKYADYDCAELETEAANIESRVNELHGVLKKENTKDRWAMSVGLIVFWPALFFLAGNKDEEKKEFSQLKGDYETIQLLQAHLKCNNR